MPRLVLGKSQGGIGLLLPISVPTVSLAVGSTSRHDKARCPAPTTLSLVEEQQHAKSGDHIAGGSERDEPPRASR